MDGDQRVPLRVHPEVVAQTLLDLGDVAGAAEHAETAVRLTPPDDWATVASTGMVLGLVREAQGRLDEAESLLREAVQVMGRTDFGALEAMSPEAAARICPVER